MLLASIVTLSLAGTLVSAAVAAPGHRYAGQVSGPGSGAGDVSSPAGLAVRASNSDVYVVDQGNNRVQRFDAAGDLLTTFAVSAAPGGGSVSGAIAIDPSSGNVYVSVTRADTSAAVVDRFSATGVFQLQIDGAATAGTAFGGVTGLAVDPSNGRVYVADGPNNTVAVYTSAGAFVSQFDGTDPDAAPFSFPTALAVDAAHDVYVVDTGKARVEKFTALGAAFSAVVDTTSPQTVAVDPGNGHVYVGGFGGAGYQIIDYTSAGVAVFVFGSPRIGASTGLGATSAGKVYVADSSAGALLTFVPFTAPDATTGAATGVTAAEATVNGTVNPQGRPTTYHFDYGTDTSYGQATAESDPPDTGSSDVSASAALSGLAPNTTYHVRLVATNADGSNSGADQSFTTTALAPLTAAADATTVTVTGATLNASVNPQNSQTSFHFEYGTTTAYGSSTAPGDAGAANASAPATATVTGLQPQTTYHFRVVADNGVGTPTTGPDTTFRTLDPPATVATGAVTDVGTTTVTLHGTIDTHGLAGTYRFAANGFTGSSQVTADTAVPAGAGPVAVTATMTGLDPGLNYTVRLVAHSSGGEAFGDTVSFTTAPAPPYIPPAPPVAASDAPYGCREPLLNGYDRKPKPGDTITITGADLGPGGTVALGSRSLFAEDWSASSLTVTIPTSATGTLPLTINCGTASNTIAIAILTAPDNDFDIGATTAKVASTTGTVSVKVPGPGKVTISGKNVTTAKAAAKQGRTIKIKVKLNNTGRNALARSKTRKLAAPIKVTFTPTGGQPYDQTDSIVFTRKKTS